MVIGQLITASLAAYAFSFLVFRGRQLLFFLFLSTLMIPWEATIIPNYMTIRTIGWLDTYQGLAVPFMATAFGTFLLRQAFLQIPRELWDAARIDGASSLRFFISTVIPLSRPILGTVAIYGFLSTYNQYFWPLLVTNETFMRTTQVGIAQLRFEETLAVRFGHGRCHHGCCTDARSARPRAASAGSRADRGCGQGLGRMEGKMRRLATFALALTMVAAACGGTTPGGGAAPSGAGDMSALAPGKDVAPAAAMTWWHAMSGVNGEAINKIVTGFNSSQSKIKVTTVFQGNYDDLLAKLNTAIASNAAPALVQVYDIGQRYMYDSQQVVPMQAFIDRDKFNTSDFEPAVINYYKYQDKLQSMPFNASTPMLYYNKDAFKEVGLDPNKPPVTFTEIADAAKKLTKKDAAGATTRYGFGPSIYGWLFERLLATSGSSMPTTATAVTIAPQRSSTTTRRARRSSIGGRPT